MKSDATNDPLPPTSVVGNDKPTRKVVQISTFQDVYGSIVLIALCDDGTLWNRDVDSAPGEQIEGVPQP